MLLLGCGSDGEIPSEDGSTSSGSTTGATNGTTTGTAPSSDGLDGGTTTGDTSSGSTDSGETGPILPDTVTVQLVPQRGILGMERVVFAVPLATGQLSDTGLVAVEHDGVKLAATSTALSTYPDGSLRSIQLQFDLDIVGETEVEVLLGITPASTGPSPVPVEDTLVVADGTEGPRVWAVLPATWLSGSGVAGPLAPAEEFAGTPAAAWLSLCDYAAWDTDAFIAQSDERGPWLYDRGTVMARGYAMTGELVPLRSQYREASIYRSGMTGAGAQVQIPVPDATDDVKYHYAQNLAIHYLLTGDVRFREAAEDIADRMATLWSDPGYAGGTDFWTERHAGFSLLAYVWAGIVSDDQSEEFWALADTAVAAYIDVQQMYPEGYDDPDARCFAHHADAHGESYGYFGCSPWMSAILADGLEQYATERDGAEAEAAREAIVKLGRILVQQGRDPANGRPYYWIGVGTEADEVDDYDEHWGESAYVIAMAQHHASAPEPEFSDAVAQLIDGLGQFGAVPHIRSFNWQCRSAVATPYYLP